MQKSDVVKAQILAYPFLLGYYGKNWTSYPDLYPKPVQNDTTPGWRPYRVVKPYVKIHWGIPKLGIVQECYYMGNEEEREVIDKMEKECHYAVLKIETISEDVYYSFRNKVIEELNFVKDFKQD